MHLPYVCLSYNMNRLCPSSCVYDIPAVFISVIAICSLAFNFLYATVSLASHIYVFLEESLGWLLIQLYHFEIFIKWMDQVLVGAVIFQCDLWWGWPVLTHCKSEEQPVWSHAAIVTYRLRGYILSMLEIIDMLTQWYRAVLCELSAVPAGCRGSLLPL